MAHIAIIGATGRAGGQLLEEALRRGHRVTAIARHASSQLSGRDGVIPVDLDVLDSAALAKAIGSHDAVFSAAHFAQIHRLFICHLHYNRSSLFRQFGFVPARRSAV